MASAPWTRPLHPVGAERLVQALSVACVMMALFLALLAPLQIHGRQLRNLASKIIEVHHVRSFTIVLLNHSVGLLRHGMIVA